MSTETNTAAVATNPTTPAHRIFVGNLTQNIENAELEKAFSEFGKVLSVRIIKKKFQNNTFGFVDMEDLEAANKAVAAINGKEFDGKAVTVELARERSTEKKPRQNRKNRAPRKNRKSSTPTDKKEDDTSAATTTATESKDTAATTSNKPARRRNNRRTAKPKDDAATTTTTAATTTESKDATTETAAASPATTSSAKSKKPKRERKPAANTADRQQSSTTLFVRNIPYSFDDAKLLEAFKEYSPKSAHVIVNKHTQKSKGFGFVEFEDAANQQKGLALHKHKVEDRELSVKVALIPEHTPDTATTTA